MSLLLLLGISGIILVVLYLLLGRLPSGGSGWGCGSGCGGGCGSGCGGGD